MSDQQFCLSWNEYSSQVSSLLNELRCDEELVDVTLCCQGRSAKAHRLMLSAASPYFRELLRATGVHQPVMVFLKDVQFDDLLSVLQFVYSGQVSVAQSRMARFVQTAELLQIRGLSAETSRNCGTPGSASSSSRSSSHRSSHLPSSHSLSAASCVATTLPASGHQWQQQWPQKARCVQLQHTPPGAPLSTESPSLAGSSPSRSPASTVVKQPLQRTSCVFQSTAAAAPSPPPAAPAAAPAAAVERCRPVSADGSHHHHHHQQQQMCATGGGQQPPAAVSSLITSRRPASSPAKRSASPDPPLLSGITLVKQEPADVTPTSSPPASSPPPPLLHTTQLSELVGGRSEWAESDAAAGVAMDTTTLPDGAEGAAVTRSSSVSRSLATVAAESAPLRHLSSFVRNWK